MEAEIEAGQRGRTQYYADGKLVKEVEYVDN